MTDGERDRPRRHLKPVRKGESAGRKTAIGFVSAISWSATWAALVVSIGTTVFLTSLGLGLNIRSLAGGSASFIDTFWLGATLTLALFLGGYFLSTSRPSPTLARAALDGLVLWGLFISIALLLAAISSPEVLSFAQLKLTPQALPAAEDSIAILILLMLGGSILGTIAGAYQFSRR